MTGERRILDISVRLQNGMPVYPGDPEVAVELALKQSEGASVNVSRACFGLHSGTHVDAPYHVDSRWPVFSDGFLPLLVGRARVVALDGAEAITAAHLAALDWDGVERVLFKTANSALWGDSDQFRDEYVSLSLDAATFLSERTAVKLVGIDYLSVEPADGGDLAVHRILLGRGVLILEGLCLAQVPAGDYELLCLPLKIDAPDGAPARALLREYEG